MAAPTWSTGERVTAAKLNSITLDIETRLPRLYLKSAVTTRNNTATYAADPELSGILLEVGLFRVELYLFATQGSATPKLKTQWGFSGTVAAFNRWCLGPSTDNISAPSIVSDVNLSAFTNTQNAVYNTSSSGAYSAMNEVAIMNVSVAGNLSLQWAQNAATAVNTNVQPGSHFVVTRIS